MTDPAPTPANAPVVPAKGRAHSLLGEPKVWFCAMGLTLGLLMVIGLLSLIIVEGVSVFWPRQVLELDVKDASGKIQTVAGEIRKEQAKRDVSPDATIHHEWLFFTGNKDVTGSAFRFVDAQAIADQRMPKDIIVAERMEYGDSIFYPVSLKLADGTEIAASEGSFLAKLRAKIAEGNARRDQIHTIEADQIGEINDRVRKLEIERRKAITDDDTKLLAELDAARADVQKEYETLAAKAGELRKQMSADVLNYRLADGTARQQAVGDLLRVEHPNAMSWWEKFGVFLHNGWDFLTGAPREANTEGGIFPAIFGTFVMTLLMSVIVTPLGVIAAIYLREYARQGLLVQMVRISVNNLAGVPSIVFGVFGLGFFVYSVGGSLDRWFFSDVLPTPTFGTGGILWASLTLALLALPVVIVATEEALVAVPRGVREAAMACGASKWQSIQRIVLPSALPGILTGVVLAMARGAG
ncbi:MAG: phosphate ABC transporter permease PstA, partial [Verrucomicrobiales bacterium]|nr:phosphate ABC transporter permease PstA [Verrucomicrobiales bacterium]